MGCGKIYLKVAIQGKFLRVPLAMPGCLKNVGLLLGFLFPVDIAEVFCLVENATTAVGELGKNNLTCIRKVCKLNWFKKT